MEFIVQSFEQANHCLACKKTHAEACQCCGRPTQYGYLAHGRADYCFVTAMLSFCPVVGSISATRYGLFGTEITAREIVGKLYMYSAALTRSVLPCVSNYYDSISAAVLLCVFGRTPVQICSQERRFVLKLIELLCKLQIVTGNMLKVNQTGVNYVLLEPRPPANSASTASVHFSEHGLQIAVLPSLKEESVSFVTFSAEEIDATQEKVVALHRNLAVCAPQIDKSKLAAHVAKTKLYELGDVCAGLCRICECDVGEEVFEAAALILQHFRKKGVNYII